MDGPKSIQSCVPVSVELVAKNEDADENVDADQTRTERPVSGQQFTQLEEIDIDFRVSGLPHAVVKQAENFRVRELVKKIESHPFREALQADLQQLTAVCCNRRGCKDNTSQDRFRSVNLYKEFAYRSEIE